MQFDPVTVARFWAKVNKENDSQWGCWEWTASCVTGGYGYFRFNGQHGMSHRFSYLLHYGEIPEGKLVCHHCDNVKCVHPDHLFLGTIRDNTVHAAEHGLITRGSETTFAKLTEAQVTEMKRHYREGVGISRLAEHYGIRSVNVDRILKGVSWKYHPERTDRDIRPVV